MEKMKGVVKFQDGKEGFRYADVQRQQPEPNEVEIKVKCIGICGSELHLYHDNHFYTPGAIIGHEFSGQISRVGSLVTEYQVGDRVVAQLDKGACGKCDFCRKGMPNFCPHGKAVGYDIDGGWAEYYCTPEHLLLKIPDNISYEQAALIEPINVVCQALIVKNTVKPGDTVLIQGCGTIGMLSGMIAKAIGAGTVIISGTDADLATRLPIAESINAIDYAVNVNKVDLKEFIFNVNHGNGVDVVVEASGAAQAIYGMTDVLKKTGNIVVLGEASAEQLPFRWNDAVFKACTIFFSFGEVYEAWDRAVKLLGTENLELEKIITHRLPLDQFKEGFELLENKKGLKVLLFP